MPKTKPKRRSAKLFRMGWSVPEIAEHYGIRSRQTIYNDLNADMARRLSRPSKKKAKT